jgi:hypothetical protein
METVPAVFDHVVVDRRRISILRVRQPQMRELVDRFLGRTPTVPQPIAETTTTRRPPPGLVTTTTAPARQC